MTGTGNARLLPIARAGAAVARAAGAADPTVKGRMSIAAVAAAACLLCAWVLAPKLHGFAYWIARTDRAAIAANAPPGWRLDVLAVEPGVELIGLVRPPAHGDAPWLLFLPGNASGIAAGFAPVLDAVASARGCGAAFWPWRGFDASTGTPSPQGLLEDARAAWRRLTQDLAIAPARIELWGYSLGSGIAVQFAAELCRAGTPPVRVVLLSAYDRIGVMRAGTFGRLLPDDVYDARAAAAAVTCPVVLVHGSADDTLPLDGARALQRAIGAHAAMVELPGSGHVDYLAELPALRW